LFFIIPLSLFPTFSLLDLFDNNDLIIYFITMKMVKYPIN
jgi:hypothetical protein